MRRVKLSVILLAMFVSSSFCPKGYLDRLWALRGTLYNKLTCSDYIDMAHSDTLRNQCGAAGMWVGTCPDQHRVGAFTSLQAVDKSTLQAGDIIAFHGAHVAAYMGNGVFLDSDWHHANKGVDYMDAAHGDPAWFDGPVRIVRWDN